MFVFMSMSKLRNFINVTKNNREIDGNILYLYFNQFIDQTRTDMVLEIAAQTNHSDQYRIFPEHTHTHIYTIDREHTFIISVIDKPQNALLLNKSQCNYIIKIDMCRSPDVNSMIEELYLSMHIVTKWKCRPKIVTKNNNNKSNGNEAQ